MFFHFTTPVHNPNSLWSSTIVRWSFFTNGLPGFLCAPDTDCSSRNLAEPFAAQWIQIPSGVTGQVVYGIGLVDAEVVYGDAAAKVVGEFSKTCLSSSA